jgi:hypothetical protein
LRFGAAVLPLKIFPKNIFFTILILVKFEVFEIFFDFVDAVDAVVDDDDNGDHLCWGCTLFDFHL